MDPSVKKIINNGGFIAALAPLIEGSEASALAAAARAHASILTWLGVKPDLDGFDGCEQGEILTRWITTDEQPDADKMNAWTADIWSAIADIAAGKIPQ